MLEVKVIQEVKNLAEFKRWVATDKKLIVVENALKPYHDGSKRIILDKNGNGFRTKNEEGKVLWVIYQKAKDMRFNEDNTIDFLLLENNDDWIKKERKDAGKDFWLKLEIIQ